MELELDIQRPSSCADQPGDAHLRQWVELVLAGRRERAELTIRLVDEAESRALNRRYRDRDRPTNVLSFPSDLPALVASDLLGDLVICVPVVSREAEVQNKALHAHWAHMVIHGLLHLLGFDHQNETQAQEMELLEIGLLVSIGIANPYEDGR